MDDSFIERANIRKYTRTSTFGTSTLGHVDGNLTGAVSRQNKHNESRLMGGRVGDPRGLLGHNYTTSDFVFGSGVEIGVEIDDTVSEYLLPNTGLGGALGGLTSDSNSNSNNHNGHITHHHLDNNGIFDRRPSLPSSYNTPDFFIDSKELDMEPSVMKVKQQTSPSTGPSKELPVLPPPPKPLSRDHRNHSGANLLASSSISITPSAPTSLKEALSTPGAPQCWSQLTPFLRLPRANTVPLSGLVILSQSAAQGNDAEASNTTNTSKIRSICESYGVINNFRVDFFSSRGVIFLSYFDIRAAQRASMSLCNSLQNGNSDTFHVFYAIPLTYVNKLNDSCIIIDGLASDISEEDIKSTMNTYGDLNGVHLQASANTNDNDNDSSDDDDDDVNECIKYLVKFFDTQDSSQALLELSSSHPWGSGVTITHPVRSSSERKSGKKLLELIGLWRHGPSATLSASGAGAGSAADSATKQRQGNANGGANGGTNGQGGSVSTPREETVATKKKPSSLQSSLQQQPCTSTPVPSPSKSTTLNPNSSAFANSPNGRRFTGYNTNGNDSPNSPRNRRKQQQPQQQQQQHQQSRQQAPTEVDQWGRSNQQVHMNYQHPRQQQQQQQHVYQPQQQQQQSQPATHIIMTADGRYHKVLVHDSTGINIPGQYNNAPPVVPHAVGGFVDSNNGQHHVYGTPPMQQHINGQVTYVDQHGFSGNGPSVVHVNQVVQQQQQHSTPPRQQQSSSGHNNHISSKPSSSSSNNKSFNQQQQQNDPSLALQVEHVRNGADTRTSLMVRNIPNKYTQQMFLDEIRAGGHGDAIDFFYLPIDFKNRCNRGYAFVNFIDALGIVPFVEKYNGKSWKNFNSDKVCAITYARIQGKAAMIKRFENSALMEKEDAYKPLVFNNGKSEEFPLKVRRSSGSGSGGGSSSSASGSDAGSDGGGDAGTTEEREK
jgi:hypothetical protein